MTTTEASGSRATPSHPTFAIVICTKDRPAALLETLESTWSQSVLPNELIVVDDGELDAAVRESIAGRCLELGIRWIYEQKTRPGLTVSRNRAAELSRCEVLFYLDDDVTCQPDCFEEILCLMTDPAVAGVTAKVIEPAFSNWRSRLFQFGYRLAGWWSVAPKGRPSGLRPLMLGDPSSAVRAKWMSGAAMAYRRAIVLRYRFDEQLVAYALGEDREFGYRLASEHWLLQSQRAVVIHRRVEGERADPFRLGYMTVVNYQAILEKTCDLNLLDRARITWSLLVIGAMHVLWLMGRNRRSHLAELKGMIAAARSHRSGRILEDAGHETCAVPRPSVDNSQTSQRRRIRVLFITNRLEPGGAEEMLVTLATRLPDHGISPAIACLKDAGPLAARCQAAEIPVYEGALKFKTDIMVIARLQDLIRRSDADVIVAAHSGGDRMFWSTLAGRRSGVPVVVWSHWCPEHGKRHLERANKMLMRWVDTFVAVGEAQRRALSQIERVPQERIQVIPNGIALHRFQDSQERSAMRARLGLTDDQVAVGIIANLRVEKRHDVFIEAARLLAPHHANLRFFIIGDGPLREAVEACRARSGIDTEVLRMLGARDDVPDLLAALDISCLCSDVECFSVSMLEAAAAGCAFIGPDAGSMPEFLDSHRNGLLIRPADVGSLADAIAELAVNPELRRRLAHAALQDVAAFCADEMAARFAGLFGRMVIPDAPLVGVAGDSYV